MVQRQVLYLGEINDGRRRVFVRSKSLMKGRSATPGWPCFLPIVRFPNTRRRMACRYGSMRWNCIGRGNGARAGWRVNFMSSLGWIASGRSRDFPGADQPKKLVSSFDRAARQSEGQEVTMITISARAAPMAMRHPFFISIVS